MKSHSSGLTEMILILFAYYENLTSHNLPLKSRAYFIKLSTDRDILSFVKVQLL